MTGCAVLDIPTRAEGERHSVRAVCLIQHGRSCCKWLVKLSNIL